jgi:hypothetical protein
VKLAITSDLHADFGGGNLRWTKEPFDALLVAGDTANSPGVAADVLMALRRYSPQTFAVDGNHESYNNISTKRCPAEIPDTLANIIANRTGSKKYEHGLDILNSSDWPLGMLYKGHVYIGVNGWYTFDTIGTFETNVEHWRGFMNDDRFCNFGDINPRTYATIDAYRVAEALRSAKAQGLRAVVMTHTAPAKECLLWKQDFHWDRSNFGGIC